MTVTEYACAKVNLGLDITGKRQDGYHLVRMVMQTLDLADTLHFEKSEEPDISLSIQASDQEKEKLACGPENLVVRAANILKERYPQQISGGVKIRLEKRIPIAAGLAGGSADAAATIRGISRLYQLDLSEKEMQDTGLQIGADVPYCIQGGTALAEGIGEKLTILPSLKEAEPEYTWILFKPEVSVSTREAYGWYDELAEGKWEEGNIRHPDIDGMVQCLQEKNTEKAFRKVGNVLEIVTGKRYPVIEEIETCMLDEGAVAAAMSGSGPSVFGIFPNRKTAWDAAGVLTRGEIRGQIFIVSAV